MVPPLSWHVLGLAVLLLGGCDGASVRSSAEAFISSGATDDDDAADDDDTDAQLLGCQGGGAALLPLLIFPISARRGWRRRTRPA